MNRREFLRNLGGAAIFSSLPGCAVLRPKKLSSTANDPYLSMVIDCAWRCDEDATLLSSKGIQTIFRYLAEADQPETGLTSKRLTKHEAETLKSAGFAIGSVYQFYSNEKDFAKYMHYGKAVGGESRRFCFQSGLRDARAALVEAEGVEQPNKSAIYFGVDGSMGPSEMHFVKDYFQAIRETVAGKYRIGVYGSGLTAATVLNAKLADFTWLPKSRLWWQTREFFNAGNWSIFQYAHMVPVASAKRIEGIDLNVVNPLIQNIGQWPLGKDYGTAANLRLLKSLRFVKTPTLRLYATPDNRGKVVAEFNGMVARTVTLVGGHAEWPKVQVADEFADLKPHGVSAQGYCDGTQLTKDYSTMP